MLRRYDSFSSLTASYGSMLEVPLSRDVLIKGHRANSIPVLCYHWQVALNKPHTLNMLRHVHLT